MRNLRRPWPLTLPLLLHDRGAAADLPGGRPRKSAGVSSAAPAVPTPKPRGTERRGRDDRTSQGTWRRVWAGPGAQAAGAGGAGPPTSFRWLVPVGDRPQGPRA